MNSLRAANYAVVFLLQTAKYLHYRTLRDCRIAHLAVHGKTLPELPRWKENLIFTMVYRYCTGSYGLISVFWIPVWIQSSLGPDLFWLDPDPRKSCEVRGAIFSLGVKLESELWQNSQN
jgi:hypothetical protein